MTEKASQSFLRIERVLLNYEATARLSEIARQSSVPVASDPYWTLKRYIEKGLTKIDHLKDYFGGCDERRFRILQTSLRPTEKVLEILLPAQFLHEVLRFVFSSKLDPLQPF